MAVQYKDCPLLVREHWDAEDLEVATDWLEENGLDPDPASLRNVAPAIVRRALADNTSPRTLMLSATAFAELLVEMGMINEAQFKELFGLPARKP